MTLPKGFDPEEAAKAYAEKQAEKAAEEKRIVDAVTEKEILLKILEKLTSIDQTLEFMHGMDAKDFARKKVARSMSGFRDSAFYE
jgi:hypothetical protein